MTGINGPINPGRPMQPTMKSEQSDTDLRQQQRGDLFDANGRRFGSETKSGREGNSQPPMADASMLARMNAFAERLGAGSDGGKVAAAGKKTVLAERAPKPEVPAEMLLLQGASAPTSAPASSAAAPMATTAALSPDLAAKVEHIMNNIIQKVDQMTLAPKPGQGPMSIAVPLDPAKHGFDGVELTMMGTGATAKIEVTLLNPAAQNVNLAAVAQQLADRLHLQFPKRAISIVEAEAVTEVAETGQSELAALFGTPRNRDENR